LFAAVSERAELRPDLVHLVEKVCLIGRTVAIDQQNKSNKPNKPNQQNEPDEPTKPTKSTK
jgi:hypothetical protein